MPLTGYSKDGADAAIALAVGQEATRANIARLDWRGRVPGTFTPDRDLPNVFGWYSAADAQTAAGVTPANNAAVVRLPDQSGLGNDLDALVTTSARPTFVASAVNGLPSIKFASGQYLRSQGDNFKQLARAQPLTYVALLKLTSSTANVGSIVGTMGDTTGAFNTAGFTALGVHNNSSDSNLLAMALSSGAVGGDPLPDSQWHVAVCVMQPAGQSITYLDGTMQMNASGHGANSASGPIQLSSPLYPIIGEIAEAGLINAVLTDDQIFAVANYLNTKAGLGL